MEAGGWTLREAQPGDAARIQALLAEAGMADVAAGADSLVVQAGDGGPLIAAGWPALGPDGKGATLTLAALPQAKGAPLAALVEELAVVAAHRGIRRIAATVPPHAPWCEAALTEAGFARDASDGASAASRYHLAAGDEGTGGDLANRVRAIASLTPLLRPRSVAVIGASRDPAAIGHRIVRLLVQGEFAGPVYPINPKAAAIASVPAYASVDAVPGPIDLAVITVPAAVVPAVVEACGRRGVAALVVISAGFAETGPAGRELQEQVAERARAHGMRLVGPNCLGVLNPDPAVSLNASFSPVFPGYGPIAMSSQSGALGFTVLEYARQLGLGLHSFVSVGNKGDVSGNDLIQFWAEDDAVRIILLYLESFGNPRRFARLARTVGRRKPILAVKAGRTPAGIRAAGSHTAALAAGETAVAALFRQTGVIRADTLEEMFDVAALLADQHLPEGPRVAIATNAGGPAILAADALAAGGMELPEPGTAAQERLRRVLPPAASLGNPVDMVAAAAAPAYREAVSALLADPGFDALLIVYIPVGFGTEDTTLTAITESVVAARRAGIRKPVAACIMTESGLAPPLIAGAERIPTYRFPEAGARAIARAYEYARWRAAPIGHVPAFADMDLGAVHEVCARAAHRGGGFLSPDEVAAILAAARLPLVPGVVAPDPEAAVAAAERLGYPAVVKLVSPTLTHKSEWGGVALDLGDADAVRDACGAIRARLAAAGQEGELAGFLVQPKVGGGIELLVGVTEDPAFGPLVAFGLGGTLVELMHDVAVRITPLTDRDADLMVRSIRGFPLLEGYRGGEPADLPAVLDLLLRVSHLAQAVPEIVAMDLNPVKAMAPGHGCTILDARIEVRAADGGRP